MAKRSRTTAFTSPSPLVAVYLSRSNPRVRVSPQRQQIQCASTRGFGRDENIGDGSSVVSTEREAPWALAYKSYVRRNGEMLCSMAWEGFDRLGRGAVFANYSVDHGNVGVARPGSGEFSTGTPSFYVSRDQLVARNDAKTIPQMAPILQRIASYDPYRQFVVVFESDGTQGADIVTPNQSPMEVWKRTKKSNADDDDAIDVESS